MPKLTATKAMSYATRRLLPGDEFVARNRDARLLVAIDKARYSEAAPERSAKPTRKHDAVDHDADGRKVGVRKTPVDKDPVDKEKLAKLRADYQEVIGKKPFARWDAAELQKRIDEALAS
jgi:hypothetical protein